MTLTIKKQLAPTRQGVNGYGYGNKKKSLTIHQTGNPRKGANAAMHAKLQAGVYGASWHWSVDDKEAIQSFEHGYQCWHASDGRGEGNLNSIAIEGCINSDGDYVQTVKNMAELAAKILKDENLKLSDMKQHHDFDKKNRKNCPQQIREGKAGIDWNDFVAMVKAHLDGKSVAVESVTFVEPKPKTKTIDQLAQEVIDGKHGSGDVRKKALGSNYSAVQSRVNDLLGAKQKPKASKPKPTKSIDQLARETIQGIHGSGESRKKALGSNYNKVQDRVNVILGGGSAKSVEQLAREVILGKHGSGEARKKSLGNQYNAVQKRVNQLL